MSKQNHRLSPLLVSEWQWIVGEMKGIHRQTQPNVAVLSAGRMAPHNLIWRPH